MFQKGMKVRIKDNIKYTLKKYGSNDEKRSWAGKVREIQKIDPKQQGKRFSGELDNNVCVYLLRTTEERSKTRSSKASWLFSSHDIAIIDNDIKEVQKKYIFDESNLIL